MQALRIALLGSTIATAGVIAAVQSPGAQAAAHVTIMSKPGSAGFHFTPNRRVIAVGTHVTWQNASGAPHTVTSKNMATWKFDKKQSAGGGTVNYTFTKTGTYQYFCKYHHGMVATIVVK